MVDSYLQPKSEVASLMPRHFVAGKKREGDRGETKRGRRGKGIELTLRRLRASNATEPARGNKNYVFCVLVHFLSLYFYPEHSCSLYIDV